MTVIPYVRINTICHSTSSQATISIVYPEPTILMVLDIVRLELDHSYKLNVVMQLLVEYTAWLAIIAA